MEAHVFWEHRVEVQFFCLVPESFLETVALGKETGFNGFCANRCH